MHEVEIWFDVDVRTDEGQEPACTLFGTIVLPMRPLVAEHISFYPEKNTSFAFRQWLPERGIVLAHSVAVEVDYISHYGVGAGDGTPAFRTQVRCVGIQVPTLDDAKSIRSLMQSQFGMDLDPYATNKLDVPGVR